MKFAHMCACTLVPGYALSYQALPLFVGTRRVNFSKHTIGAFRLRFYSSDNFELIAARRH